MARRDRALIRAPIIRVAPAAPSRGRRALAAARRGARVVARGVREEGVALGAVGGAAVMGYLDGRGMLDGIPLPEVGGSKVPALAAATYLVGRAVKNKHLRRAGIGLAAAAAYSMARDAARR